MKSILHTEAERFQKLKEKFSVEAAAAYTGLSVAYLNKLRTTGGGAIFIKIGRRVVYDREDLDAWLDTMRRSSTSDTGVEAA